MAKSKNNNRKNEIIETLKKEVLNVFLNDSNRSFNYKQISKLLGITDRFSRENVVAILDFLVEKGSLIDLSRGKFRINPILLNAQSSASTIEGIVDMMQTGKAYVAVNDASMEDVFISALNTNRALHGDKVKVQLFPRRKNKKMEGRIVEVIERVRTTFVGVMQIGNRVSFFVPDNPKMLIDIVVPNDSLNGAKNGEKVIVKLEDWPEHSKNPIGAVIEVLGMPGDNEVEMKSIMAGIDYPWSFPKEVDDVADAISEIIPESEIKNRKDFRNIFTITIDPDDAKDFDDAISFQKLENGKFEVGIHIADVSYYVKPDSIIDKEAYTRATSVYLVDRTIPMLPEKLSNKVCSLRPDEEKLCFSAVFEMDSNAHVTSEWYGRTIINSDRRYSYEEAQDIIETNTGDYVEEMLTLDALAKKLRAERFNQGAINFESTEVKFHLDENSKPIGVYIKEIKDSNQLIEEFMLLANRKVASLIGSKSTKEKEKVFVYRIHDEPNQEKVAAFSMFLKKLGYSLRVNSRKTFASSLNQIFEDTKGKGEQNMIESIAVRTMSKAHYSTDNIGHYGLGFPYYTHFTSPIRRYPDLMVHRLLEKYLAHQNVADKEFLEAQCKHSSIMEVKAADAERASVKYKQAEYLADKIGEEFNAQISGVSKWGLFVEIKENRCEGLVSMKRMTDDFYTLDEENYQMVGMRHGKKYRLGDPIKIKVRHVDLFKKQIDFDIVNQTF